MHCPGAAEGLYLLPFPGLSFREWRARFRPKDRVCKLIMRQAT
jgi:hypothetical protein